MAGNGKDPLAQYSYLIEVSGNVTGYFTECSGLGSEHEIIEHKIIDPQGKELIQMVPGRLKWEKITLKRGITNNTDIWTWRKKVEQGDVEGARTNGSIIMLDQHLKPAAQWDFENGWPAKVSGP